jgi:hypothetical protein
MNYLKAAIENDLNKNYLEAIEHYERSLTFLKNPPVESFSNLAFIYWKFATDFNLEVHYRIPQKWIEVGGRKYPETIRKGLYLYPNSLELNFWMKYFPHRDFLMILLRKNARDKYLFLKGIA